MRRLDDLLLGLLAAAVAAFGLHSLGAAVAIGDRPGLAAWDAPLVLASLVGGLLTLGATLARRNGAGGALAACVSWTLGVRGLVELPAAATNFEFLDGPHLAPWTLVVATLLGLYAGAARAGAVQRAAVLCVGAAAANGRFFARDTEAVYALWGLAVVWLAVEVARGERRRLAGAGRLWVAVGAAFVLWVLLAALFGGSVPQGLRVASRVAAGALLALGLAAGLDERGRRAVLGAFVAAAVATLVAAGIALVQAAGIEGTERVLASRFRLFGLHPNGIGPFLAAGAVASAGLAIAARERSTGGARAPAVVGLALTAALSALLLVATESRASLLGGVVAAAALVACLGLRPPRRAWPSVALVLAPAAAVVLAWVGPLGPRLRAALDASALGPSAIGQRYHFWRMALAGLEEHPWFGVGPNQYEALARYAQPSYYDGTTQTLHSHNVELAVAAGAGWPALVLLSGLFVALLEAARRALLAADGRAARARVGAVLGIAVAVLAANQLDLGQTQQTFVPSTLWIALGWLASTAATPLGPPLGPARLLAWPASLVFLQPLLGIGLHEHAGRLLEAGRTDEALAAYRRAAGVDPAQLLSLTSAAAVARSSGRPAVELELRESVVDRAPGRPGAWLSLARALFERGRFEATEAAVERADALDPRGERRATAAILRAGLALARGDVEDARARLERSVREQGRPWTQLATVRLPTPPDEPTARPVGFVHPGGALPLAELLETVGADALASADDDPVSARRMLRSVVDGYLAESRPLRAVHWLERYRLRRGEERLPSLDTLEIDARLAAGDAEGALRLVRELEHVAHATVQVDAARAALASGDPGLAAEALDRARELTARTDLFFEAGVFRDLSELELEEARLRRDWTAARAAFDRAWRERASPGDRASLAAEHWRALTGLEPDLATVLHALRHRLAARSAERRGVTVELRRREFRTLLGEALTLAGERAGELLERVEVLEHTTGWAGAEFLALAAAEGDRRTGGR